MSTTIKNFHQFLIEKVLTNNSNNRLFWDVGEFELKDQKSPYFSIKWLEKNQIDILKIVPDFEKNFKRTQKLFDLNKEVKRKDMPRLKRNDVLQLQAALLKGEIDINKPFSTDTDVKNPFPEGLKGQEAQEFLKRGLTDGNVNDDKINVKEVMHPINKLKPIQSQIYLDQTLEFFINYKNLSDIQKQITDRYFLVSADLKILDGHHRLAIASLCDFNCNTPCIMVDLPLSKLLPLSVAYGDSIGNKRNL